MSPAPAPGFGPRPAPMPLKRGAIDFTDAVGLETIANLVAGAPLPPVTESAAEEFVGVTTDGTPRRDLLRTADRAVTDTRGAVSAAAAFLGGLRPGQRRAAHLPSMDRAEWRLWTNAFLTFPEHGLLLQELDPGQLALALAVLEASLSPAGYTRARRAMRSNGALGELLGGRYPDTLTEFCYWLTLFGDVSAGGAWGWQLQGHHVDLHCVFAAGTVSMTPVFLGTEYEGDEIFHEHRERAVELMAGLGPAKRDRALLYGSMLAPVLPLELAGRVDGRHRAGAGRDNLVLPYEGLCAASFTRGQRGLLLDLLTPYLDGLPRAPESARRADVERYLDETYLAWIGPRDGGGAFYYRVHSPVILVEYDNHSGIFIDNDEPEPVHVHTIVRTPNGGDYGKSLLNTHYSEAH
jgi:hypothetical protein